MSNSPPQTRLVDSRFKEKATKPQQNRDIQDRNPRSSYQLEERERDWESEDGIREHEDFCFESGRVHPRNFQSYQ